MSGPTTIPFRARADIPIVGQILTVLGWHRIDVVLVRCNCDDQGVFNLVGIGSAGQCPACHRGYVVQGISHDPKTGQTNIQVGQVLVQAPAAASETEVTKGTP